MWAFPAYHVGIKLYMYTLKLNPTVTDSVTEIKVAVDMTCSHVLQSFEVKFLCKFHFT